MSVATALVSAPVADPALAERAVRAALERAGLEQARGVLLFLSGEFSRQLPAALLAAARAGGCLQVFGGMAGGLYTECGSTTDQAAAAALVLGAPYALAPTGSGEAFLLHVATGSLPASLPADGRRFGLVVPGQNVWQSGRVQSSAATATITGARCHTMVSPGLREIGGGLVEDVHGHELRRLAGQDATSHLRRQLPPDLRGDRQLPLHTLVAGRQDEHGDMEFIPLLAQGADGTLTLASAVACGTTLHWFVRQPLAAEQELRQRLQELPQAPANSFGLLFSCISRGPWFYGGEDRDLAAWRERFPGMPMLGAYGLGQIAPADQASRLYSHSAVGTVFSPEHHDV
jgi:small ligand-binding sensory domain FIST